MKNINFVYHIGERCNLLAHLVNSNLLSGMNCFSGLYISFNSVIDIIKNDYNNFENNIVKFKILQLKNIEDNSIVFIRCIDYDQEELNKIKNLILNCDWNFFYKENYYRNHDYCINLSYTDIENFQINDLYYYKNNYCIMPNSDYLTNPTLETFYRRKNRFQTCLKNENSESILLIYMDKLIIDNDINLKISEIVKIYQFKYNLFYIIPIYSNCIENIENEKIINIGNITFYTIYFNSLEFQKNNNPGDDNSLGGYQKQYDKITDNIKKLYNLDIVKFY